MTRKQFDSRLASYKERNAEIEEENELLKEKIERERIGIGNKILVFADSARIRFNNLINSIKKIKR